MTGSWNLKRCQTHLSQQQAAKIPLIMLMKLAELKCGVNLQSLGNFNRMENELYSNYEKVLSRTGAMSLLLKM